MFFVWISKQFIVFLQLKIRFPTSYHNKAVIAEGVKPILPLRWEFFVYFLVVIDKLGKVMGTV